MLCVCWWFGAEWRLQFTIPRSKQIKPVLRKILSILKTLALDIKKKYVFEHNQEFCRMSQSVDKVEETDRKSRKHFYCANCNNSICK